jgi:hypothetical protein
MQKTCNSCGSEKKPQTVPYIVHESDMSRLERQLKRLWIVVLVLIFMLVGSNCAWLWYESQFETVESTVEEVVVDADENGIANYIGNDGDIINGNGYSKKDHN